MWMCRTLSVAVLMSLLAAVGCERSKVTHENLKNVQSGQTRAEVEDALGPGTYTAGTTPDRNGTVSHEVWYTGDEQFDVGYDKDGKVCFYGSQSRDQRRPEPARPH